MNRRCNQIYSRFQKSQYLIYSIDLLHYSPMFIYDRSVNSHDRLNIFSTKMRQNPISFRFGIRLNLGSELDFNPGEASTLIC